MTVRCSFRATIDLDAGGDDKELVVVVGDVDEDPDLPS
jgi:hypothetical protein